jgi:hypothetical protein
MKRIPVKRLNTEEMDWLRLSPAKRILESAKLWKFYLAMGGGRLTLSPILVLIWAG